MRFKDKCIKCAMCGVGIMVFLCYCGRSSTVVDASRRAYYEVFSFTTNKYLRKFLKNVLQAEMPPFVTARKKA